jgi:acetyl-CoA/propionyl-CoA carboxylase carboxyl transferase subunit
MGTAAAPGAAALAVLESRRSESTRSELPRPPREFTARGRAELLCDTGTFVETLPDLRQRRARYGDGDGAEAVAGVVTGWGEVDGRPIIVVSQDFSVAGGSIDTALAQKTMHAQRLALRHRWPIVFLNDSGGARIHEGVAALHGCGGIFALNVQSQRVIPQISVIMGPCAGASAYSPALTDWVVMVRGRSQMFLTGPEVVRAATGEEIETEALGGADLHTKVSGVAHLSAPDERSALERVRLLLGYLPSSAGDALPNVAMAEPAVDADTAFATIPESPNAPFDISGVLAAIFDEGPTLELMSRYGTSVLTAFARLGGMPVGVVASQSKRRGGILDSASSVKIAKFVDFCGRFGIPVTTFVDVPGFMPGSAEERRGVIDHGAKVLAAYAGAAVPKLTVLVRKAYGGAYIAMGSRSLGAHFAWAWPSAELAVMGPEAAVGILHRRELAEADDTPDLRRSLAAEYRAAVTPPYHAADVGIIDEVIAPGETRLRMINALRFLLRRSPRELEDSLMTVDA